MTTYVNREQINHYARQPLTYWFLALGTLIAMGLGAALIVFTQGLSVTNLSDLVPWGLWISIDLSAIALSGGAFAVSAIVYLMRRKELQPVAKTAVFVGLIGYSIAMMMLLMDIGRPDRFWHGFVFWNIHSPLWEVTMCVGLYTSVLALEVAPIIGHWKPVETRVPRISGYMTRIHKLAPVLALVGLCLSTLHQSSLGLTYGKLAARPVWFQPWTMAVLFYISAIVGGLALVTLVTLVAGRFSSRARVNPELTTKLAHVVGWGALALLILRWAQLMSTPVFYTPAWSEALDILTRGRLAFNFWGLEIVLGLVVPSILLLMPRFRRDRRVQMLALALVAIGVIAYRWDTNLVGQLVVFGQVAGTEVPHFTTYSPSLIEILAGAGVIAYGLLAVTIGVRHLNVIDHGHVSEAPADVTPSAAMATSSSR